MSELMNNTSKRLDASCKLLAGVSALPLIVLFPALAVAGEEDKPTVWIEVGGQLDRLSDGQESFAPPFVSTLLENPFTPPSTVQAPPRYSTGEEGRLSFSPRGSSWVFSASVRYGRANSSGSRHEETSPASPMLVEKIPYYNLYLSFPFPPGSRRFANTTSQTHDAHLVLDFQAGRDVGLGALGAHGISTINAGVRFVQFTSQSKATIDSDPNFAAEYRTITGLGPYQSGYAKLPSQEWDLYAGKFAVTRSFHGIGPSLEWNANAMLIGNPESGSVTFDWALSGALLFGRQKASAHHTTMAHHKSAQHASGALPTLYPATSRNTVRSRSVVVPNIGGFAGLSMRFPNAKITFGYRVDAFFGAMDGGIDTRKTYDRDFYGPFATISIGLGG